MKKVICLLLCAVLMTVCCSCSLFGGKNQEDTVVETTSKRKAYITKDEVAKLVSQGKVSGLDFALGTPVDTIKKAFLDELQPETTAAKTKVVKKKGKTKTVKVAQPTQNPQFVTYIGDDESYYEYYVGNSLTSVSYKDEKYFLVNSNIEKGAAILVSTSSAYNFKVGNCYSADIIHSLGEPDCTDVPTSDQLFFCLGSPVNPTRLTYNFGTKRLDFILSDDKLIVVLLTDTTLYSGFKSMPATANTSAESTITSK